MRTEAEIRAILDKFDAADEEGELDCDGEATREALLWVLGIREDSELEQHLPEEE